MLATLPTQYHIEETASATDAVDPKSVHWFGTNLNARIAVLIVVEQDVPTRGEDPWTSQTD
jgi:hypothetical protein